MTNPVNTDLVNDAAALSELIYLPVHGQGTWEDLYRHLSNHFGVSIIGVFGERVRAIGPLDPAAGKAYRDRYQFQDLRLSRLREAIRKNDRRVYNDSDLFTKEEIAQSPIHNEYFSRFNFNSFIGGGAHISPEATCAAMIFFGDSRPRTESEHHLLKYCVHQLAQATLILERLECQGEAMRAVLAQAASGNRGMILVDARARMSESNATAKAWIEANFAVADGCLTPQGDGQARLLHRAIFEVLQDGDESSQPIMLTGISGGRFLFQAHAAAEIINYRRKLAVLTIIPIEDGQTMVPPERELARLRSLGLSLAEARLACLVGRGLMPADAATTLGIALTTARSTLSSVYAKLSITGQTQLARLVATLA